MMRRRFPKLSTFFRALTPGDFIVIFTYIGIFILFLILSVQNIGAAGSVLIQASGTEYRYELGSPRTVEFEGPIGKTILEVTNDGRARFVHSDCRDKICISFGYLERGGDWAACLPNRIIARMNKQIEDAHGSSGNHDDHDIDAGSY